MSKVDATCGTYAPVIQFLLDLYGVPEVSDLRLRLGLCRSTNFGR